MRDLHFLDIHCQVMDPHFPQVAIPRDLRKDWSPDRHFAGSMPRRQWRLASDDSLYFFPWEFTAVALRDPGEVRSLGLQIQLHRAVAVSVQSVAHGAVRLV